MKQIYHLSKLYVYIGTCMGPPPCPSSCPHWQAAGSPPSRLLPNHKLGPTDKSMTPPNDTHNDTEEPTDADGRTDGDGLRQPAANTLQEVGKNLCRPMLN